MLPDEQGEVDCIVPLFTICSLPSLARAVGRRLRLQIGCTGRGVEWWLTVTDAAAAIRFIYDQLANATRWHKEGIDLELIALRVESQ